MRHGYGSANIQPYAHSNWILEAVAVNAWFGLDIIAYNTGTLSTLAMSYPFKEYAD
jgi:hypothetical protein